MYTSTPSRANEIEPFRRPSTIREAESKPFRREKQPKKEKFGLCADQSKPADIYIHIFNDRKPLLIDVGITSPLREGHWTADIDDIGSAAADYATVKEDKYNNKIDWDQMDFLPFIVEAFGGFGKEAIYLLKRLSSELQGPLNSSAMDILNQMKREIVINIWKVNARMIMDRVPCDT